MADGYSHTIFDGLFNGMGGGELYRSYVIPELYPSHQKAPQPRLENWDPEEIAIWIHGSGDPTITKEKK